MRSGLWIAPASFTALMEPMFPPQIGKDLEADLEALLMSAQKHAEWIPILDRTLGLLIDAGLTCKETKRHLDPDSIG